MSRSSLSVVTGAFGYSGKYIARRLLEQGATVKTLTRTPTSHSPFGNRVEALPLDFGDFNGLVENLRGAATLYNTYWIRFARGTVTHDVAVQNSRILIGAAAEAAVSRIVHISITNPSEDSPLPYFRGKALVEKAIHESGLSYAILRPTVPWDGKTSCGPPILMMQSPEHGLADGSLARRPLHRLPSLRRVERQ